MLEAHLIDKAFFAIIDSQQSPGKKYYMCVEPDGLTATCTCPDYRFRRSEATKECKHLVELRKVISRYENLILHEYEDFTIRTKQDFEKESHAGFRQDNSST